MANSPEEAAASKKRVYGCPAPTCPYATPDPERMNEHVNDEHDGEWLDADWPSPPEDV